MSKRNYLQDTTGTTNAVAVDYFTGLLNKRAKQTSKNSFFDGVKLLFLSLQNAGSFFFS